MRIIYLFYVRCSMWVPSLDMVVVLPASKLKKSRQDFYSWSAAAS
jgi:hypothetical protein